MSKSLAMNAKKNFKRIGSIGITNVLKNMSLIDLWLKNKIRN